MFLYSKFQKIVLLAIAATLMIGFAVAVQPEANTNTPQLTPTPAAVPESVLVRHVEPVTPPAPDLRDAVVVSTGPAVPAGGFIVFPKKKGWIRPKTRGSFWCRGPVRRAISFPFRKRRCCW